MKFLKSRWFWILLVILIIGYFGYRKFAGGKGETVETATIARGEVVKELILSGEVSADEDAKMAFQTGGELARVNVQEGDLVTKGTVLGGLDTYKLQQDLIRAQFDLRQGDATVYRVYDEVKGHDSDETFEQAEDRTIAEVARDKAYYAERKVKEDIANATLRSPINGIVTTVTNKFAGVNVTAGQTQFEVVNPDTIRFVVNADQTEVIGLSPEQEVKIILDSYPDEEITGTVERISYVPETGETGTLYAVHVFLQNYSAEELKYKIGMTGDAVFVTAKAENVLYVPLQFIKVDDQGSYLLVGNAENKVYVKTGIEGDENVEVSGDGIEQGMTIFNI